MFEIEQATEKDVKEIVNLLNITYRGKDSFKGWTTEADIIKGPIRTDANIITNLMKEENSIFLKCENEKNKLIGCVHLKKNNNRLYLGMLSVLPPLQGKGIGKLFLKAAEEKAKELNCRSIYMQVISDRKELTEWYLRHGYVSTGDRKVFDVDTKYGVPTKKLEFI